VKKGGWVPLHRLMRVECCECSLVHDIEVRVRKIPQWRATPNLKETAKARKAKRGKEGKT